MIEAIKISKKFGKFQALKDVSFKIRNGEVVGYVGLNGAGKTTTIKICVGALIPNSGDVLIDGYSITGHKREASSNVGWVPELPIFEMDQKALDYFVYLAGYYGLSSDEARRKAKELFDIVGLSDFMYRKLKDYSLGMKKRFALAISMINDPKNFFFDEVLNGLDPKGIAFFRELVKKFKHEKKAIFFSSHILSEVENIADRVIFLHKGRIIAKKTMNEIRQMAKPALLIKVANPDNNLIKLLEKYGNVKLEDEYYVVDLKEMMAKNSIIEELVANNYKIQEIKALKSNLEKVFFKLIGEEE